MFILGWFVFLLQVAQNLFVLMLILWIFLSYFMDHYHPVYRFLDSIIEPMLRPIRRMLPTFGGFDFSPLVLILLVQLLIGAIINLLSLFL